MSGVSGGVVASIGEGSSTLSGLIIVSNGARWDPSLVGGVGEVGRIPAWPANRLSTDKEPLIIIKPL
jgi:hypothetical protein